MAGGAYVALSGLRARMEQLDRLAADIANAGTAGYKAERTTTVAAERLDFAQVLQTAVDVASGPGRLDFRNGTISPTGRDLDFALDGRGFFVVQTPEGVRYTRNGQFDRRADGTLVTQDGYEVLGENGPIRLGNGTLSVSADGTIRAGGTVIDRLRVVDFDDYTMLGREEAGRFRTTATPKPATAEVRGSALEQSNVALVERMAQVIEVGRSFEALQRGVSMLFNEIDGRAISEFGRR